MNMQNIKEISEPKGYVVLISMVQKGLCPDCISRASNEDIAGTRLPHAPRSGMCAHQGIRHVLLGGS